MKRDLSNHFCIIPPECLAGFMTPEDCRYMPHGSMEIICTRKIVLDQSPVSDSDGNRWSISMSAATSDATVQKFDGCRVYVGVFLTDGTIRVLAAPGYIPKITVAPYPGTFSVSVNFEALKFIEI